MRTSIALTCLPRRPRRGSALRRRAGFLALAVLFAAWVPLGGALAAAPVPAAAPAPVAGGWSGS